MSRPARRLAAAMHARVCCSLSWSEECRREDGGSHAAYSVPEARRILASADPAAELHGSLCDADLNASTSCPNRPAHIRGAQELLIALGVL